MSLSQAILTALLSLPRFSLDTETEGERAARMAVIAGAESEAVDQVSCTGHWATIDCRRIWPGSRRQLAAALITVGWHESRYSELVHQGRCSELPKGMQCDHGKARTVFQLWQVACPKAWEQEPGSVAELQQAAVCAARLLSNAYRMCATDDTPNNWAGAFSRYGRAYCRWPGGISRAATMARVLSKFDTVVSRSVPPDALGLSGIQAG